MVLTTVSLSFAGKFGVRETLNFAVIQGPIFFFSCCNVNSVTGDIRVKSSDLYY